MERGAFAVLPVCKDVFAGPAPLADDIPKIKAAGCRAVICLLEFDPETERKNVEAAGMEFVWLPVPDGHPPEDWQVARALDVLKEKPPVFIHCLGGRGRTRTLLTCIRVNMGMGVQEAIRVAQYECSFPFSELQETWLRRRYRG